LAAARHHLVIEQGATFTLQLAWKDEQGQPVDLSGYHIRAQVRPSAASSTVLLAMDSDAPAPGVSFGALDASGVIDITVTATVTAGLDFNSAVYDLEAEAPAGYVTRLLEGNMRLSREVTR
jgi:hypothetical protein